MLFLSLSTGVAGNFHDIFMIYPWFTWYFHDIFQVIWYFPMKSSSFGGKPNQFGRKLKKKKVGFCRTHRTRFLRVCPCWLLDYLAIWYVTLMAIYSGLNILPSFKQGKLQQTPKHLQLGIGLNCLLSNYNEQNSSIWK